MRIKRVKGFTLVEVIVGLLVFAVLATSSSVAFVQTQKLAHANVMHNTARTVIQGYVEQIKGIPYYQLLEVMADPENTPIQTKSVSTLTEGDDILLADTLFLNQVNQKTILLDIIDRGEGDFDTHTMSLDVTPTASNILGSAGIEVIEFTVTFQYQSIFKGMNANHTGTTRFIKTSVSEF